MKHITWYLLIIVLLYGVQNGNAQHKDPSPLEGFQIRPLDAFLRVRQSQLLTVKNCVPYQQVGEDLLGALMFECDISAFELAPLLETATTTKWSVNGIEGGNEKVGKIKAQSNVKALYTAPAIKPVSNTIQASVEIETKGQGKRLLVSNITILDKERVYYGTVEINGMGDGVSFSAFGLITFKETGKDTDSFNSITGSINVHYAVDDCEVFQGKLPLAGELYLYETDEDRSFAGGTHHGISFFADIFEINCHGVNVHQGLLAVMAPCDGGAYGKSIEEGKILVGDGNCEGINIKWKLTKQ